jgi:uncharacterized protein
MASMTPQALRRPTAALLAALAVGACTPRDRPATPGTVATAPEAFAPAGALYRPGALEDVALTDGFWRPRLERNRRTTIPYLMRQNRETGRVANFERAAGRDDGAYEGRRFNDTDVYKAIEAASWALLAARDGQPDQKESDHTPESDRAVRDELDLLVALIAAAQEEDGYLIPARSVDPENPAPGLGAERWIHVSAGSHELYNAGHLIEAAVAHHRATGDRTLLDVAIRFADRIHADFGADSGSGARRDVPGHEEIELALVKLADETGEERYRELARFFLDQRGREHDGEPYPEDSAFAIYNDRRYRQDEVPVAEATEAVGHAVRATYLYSAMTDVGIYGPALGRIWNDLVSHKLYLTGGIGSRDTFESFGEPYELPNETAYAETCAAIGNDLWNHRMFLATGEARYLDVMERVLYNGFLSGVSISGDRFFYTNPLASDGGVERSPWFEVACCPANLARMMALLPTFAYAVRDGSEGGRDEVPPEILVALYVGSEARLDTPGGPVRVVQRTDYPWSGTVRIAVEPDPSDRPRELVLALRIPGWARGEPVPSDLYRFDDPAGALPTLRVAGRTIALADGRQPLPGGGDVTVADGFARIRRVWPGRPGEDAPVEWIELELPMPVRRVAAHPSVAANRGRRALQRGPLVYAVEGADHGGTIAGISLPAEPDDRFLAHYRPDLLDGVVTLEDDRGVTAIPYFAWANRGPGQMAVWLPFDGE